MSRYFLLGPIAGTPLSRYALLADDGRTVESVQASRPDGTEIERPAHVRWRRAPRPIDVEVTDLQPWNNRGPLTVNTERHNGEQPRRAGVKRGGRTASHVEPPTWD